MFDSIYLHYFNVSAEPWLRSQRILLKIKWNQTEGSLAGCMQLYLHLRMLQNDPPTHIYTTVKKPWV